MLPKLLNLSQTGYYPERNQHQECQIQHQECQKRNIEEQLFTLGKIFTKLIFL